MKLPSLLTALALTLGASRADAGSPAPAPQWLAGVSNNGVLVMFASDDPATVTKVKIKGLQKKERIVALDVRPLTGQLYGLGSTSRLYTINWETGQATQVGSGQFNPLLDGGSFAFDFNPTVDRIRIISDDGQNFRVNPDTGAIAAVDAGLAYAGGDPGFGSIPAVCACAYNNNDNDPLTTTTLFDIDTDRDVLVRQDPPNAGTLNTIGALGLDATEVAGFDVSGSNGVAYASLVVRNNLKKKKFRATLCTIDLTTGAATVVGKIGGPWPLTSLTALGPVVTLVE